MKSLQTSVAALVAIALFSITPMVAHAQFGNAGATHFGPGVPGVDMPFYGVYNYLSRMDPDAPSDFVDATRRTQIVQIRMEGVFDSQNPSLHPRITGAIMLPVDFVNDPWPVMFPTTSTNAPAHTNVRSTRNFGREVYNDMAIIWNIPGLADVQPGTEYDLYIFVDWPAGVGQGFGAPYNSGSDILSVRYTVR